MEEKKIKNTSDHLANERTFLAWIRTSIGMMAFGFVVVKFALFVKQLTLLIGKQHVIPQNGYSSTMGIALVVAGTLVSIMAYFRYKKAEKQINENNYHSSSLLTSMLIGFICLISILLVAYLIESI